MIRILIGNWWRQKAVSFFVFLCMITGCQVYRSEMVLVPTSFQDLLGYEKDSLQEATWPVIKKTCNQLLKSDSTKPMLSKPDGQVIIKDWHPFLSLC